MKYFWVITCFFCCCSCNHRENSAHLPRQQMQSVLEDIHLAEAYSVLVSPDSVATNEKNYDSLALYCRLIFKHYNITSAEFEQSLDWYKRNPEELDSIYANMIDQIQELETKYNVRKP